MQIFDYVDDFYWHLAETPYTTPLFGILLALLVPVDFVFWNMKKNRSFWSFQKYSLGQKQKNLEWAVVLGCGLENGEVCSLLAERLDSAAKLLKAGKIQKIFLSGDSHSDTYDEPAAMKRYLQKKYAVADSIVLIDGKGYSTEDTFRNVFDLNIHECYVCTNDFHMTRCIWHAFQIGLHAYPCHGKTKIAPTRWGWLFREKMALYITWIQNKKGDIIHDNHQRTIQKQRPDSF